MKYSRSINELPYEVNRFLWLIGSRDFYICTDLLEYNENKRKTSKKEFIKRVSNSIDLNCSMCLLNTSCTSFLSFFSSRLRAAFPIGAK